MRQSNSGNINNEFDMHFDKNEIYCKYEGIFDNEIINFFTKKLHQLTSKYQSAQKKLISTFIELAQNVGYYSEWKIKDYRNKNIGAGKLIIGETKNQFFFCMANSINQKNAQILQKKCELINTSDREELRAYKRKQRTLIQGTNGGAHIGLIMISLLTRKPLEYKFVELEKNEKYFIITTKIDKQKQN